jgi:hypothetical protein
MATPFEPFFSMARTDRLETQNTGSRVAVTGAVLVVMMLACTTTGRAFESSYSSIAEKQCRKFDALDIDGSAYAESRVCRGRGGYKVFVDEADLRETLTVGLTMRQAGREPAARDHYGAFNSYGDVIEWRSVPGGKPYALIAGWSFADNDNLDITGRPKSVRLLVVMRLPPGPVCKVAYIDRAANSDADELARRVADKTARNFICGADSVQVIGKSGPATDAMARRAQEGRPKP